MGGGIIGGGNGAGIRRGKGGGWAGKVYVFEYGE